MANLNQPWTMVLYNHLGKVLGGIDNAHERNFTFQFNAPQLITFTLDTTNPTTKRILEHREEALYVVLLYHGTLCLTTEITGLELIGSADTKSLAVTCTETMWTRLMPRLIGKSVAGYEVAAATDKLTIVKTLVEALNAESSGNFSTGITPLSKTLGVTVTLEKMNYVTFQEILEKLAFSASGFDFWQSSTMNGSPGEYANGVTGVIEYAERKGKNRSSVKVGTEEPPAFKEMAIFEYGAGTKANIQNYGFTQDYTLLANSVYVLPSGFPTSNFGSGVVYNNTPAQKLFGYRDALTTDISTKALAEALAEDAGKIRQFPRQMFTFQPLNDRSKVPEFKPGQATQGRYEVGDIVSARVRDNGIELVNAAVRVYANNITLDDQGGQTEVLTLSMSTS